MLTDEWQAAAVSAGSGWTNETFLPTKKWACVEFEFKGPSNEMRFYLDGNEVISSGFRSALF